MCSSAHEKAQAGDRDAPALIYDIGPPGQIPRPDIRALPCVTARGGGAPASARLIPVQRTQVMEWKGTTCSFCPVPAAIWHRR